MSTIVDSTKQYSEVSRRKGRKSPALDSEGGAHSTPVARLLTLGACTLSAVYFLMPLWWLLVSSTKSNSGLFSSNGFWFADVNLWENISQVFTENNGNYIRWVGNSLVYAGVGALVATILGAACGYALAKYSFPGKGPLFGLIMVGVLLPNALLTVPLYLMFSGMGLVNTPWAVLIPSVVSPFAVYLCKMFVETTIPDELIESARVDGAGEIRIFVTIVLKLLGPALVTVFLFTFVSIWNNFFLPMIMLTDEKLYPVTLGVYSWYTTYQQSTYNIVLMGSLISVIPLVIAFLSLQRFWRSGLMAGGVKG